MSWGRWCVRAGENGKADHVDVFLDGGGGDHLGGLAQAGVDDLHASVAQARAIIFAPRSWPSSPGLAISTLIFFCGIESFKFSLSVLTFPSRGSTSLLCEPCAALRLCVVFFIVVQT